MVKAVWDFIKTAVKGVIDLIQSIFNFVGKILDTIFGLVQKVAGAIPNLIKGMIDTIFGFLNGLVSFVQSLVGIFTGAGENAGAGFFNGISKFLNMVRDAVKGVVDFVSNIVSGIGNTIQGVIGFISGSHANGLEYVPYDGYIAELHKGERVLTKNEAQDYREGSAGTSGATYNIKFESPVAIDEYQASRLLKQTVKELDL